MDLQLILTDISRCTPRLTPSLSSPSGHSPPFWLHLLPNPKHAVDPDATTAALSTDATPSPSPPASQSTPPTDSSQALTADAATAAVMAAVTVAVTVAATGAATEDGTTADAVMAAATVAATGAATEDGVAVAVTEAGKQSLQRAHHITIENIHKNCKPIKPFQNKHFKLHKYVVTL